MMIGAQEVTDEGAKILGDAMGGNGGHKYSACATESTDDVSKKAGIITYFKKQQNVLPNSIANESDSYQNFTTQFRFFINFSNIWLLLLLFRSSPFAESVSQYQRMSIF